MSPRLSLDQTRVIKMNQEKEDKTLKSIKSEHQQCKCFLGHLSCFRLFLTLIMQMIISKLAFIKNKNSFLHMISETILNSIYIFLTYFIGPSQMAVQWQEGTIQEQEARTKSENVSDLFSMKFCKSYLFTLLAWLNQLEFSKINPKLQFKGLGNMKISNFTFNSYLLILI